MDLTVVIPAFNEGTGIASALETLTKALRARNVSVPILVIDDGSTDDTGKRAAAVSGVTVITHKRNKGYGAALKTGIRAAKTEWVMTYDADGQHTPENFFALAEQLDEQTDLLIGKRDGYKGPWIRQPGKRLIGTVANFVTEQKIPDYNSGMRVFRREKVLPYLHLFPNGFSLSTTSTVCFLKEGLNVAWTPITIQKRNGKSTVKASDAGKTFMLILRLIMLFSPLRIFLPVSMVMGLVAVGLLAYELILNSNISDASVAMVSLTCFTFFFGLLADQVAALRREIGRHGS